jgi:SAM-dependent methyltransferase/uncharacterized protein YbaR (Trm112 family)
MHAMRYSLLDLLASPDTGAPFVLVGATEAAVPYSGPYGKPATRVSPPGAQVGPAPQGETGAFYTRHLAPHASAPDDPQRNREAIVTDGLLVATDTGMWYPIVDTIPEILPPSLRDWGSHHAYLDQVIAPRLPPELVEALRQAIATVDSGNRQGDGYKTSEIGLLGKVEDKANFLAPGLLSPFNPNIYHHPADLVRGFANCLPFLQLEHGHCVLDSGSGYGWTTEWLMKLGIDAVGIDISRVYPDIGRQRMGPNNQPHLVVGDVENLPFRAGVFDAVLCFDAFHHIPNRPAAMRRYERALKDEGRIVLLEPGGQHEEAEMSVQVMDTYGIMEVGMELADVQGYIDGIETFGSARQVFLAPSWSDDPRQAIPASELRARSIIGWGMFVIEKGPAAVARRLQGPAAPGAATHSDPGRGNGKGGLLNRIIGR